MSYPKNWIKADAVRVRRNGGKLVLEVRRKKKKATKRKATRRRKPTTKRKRK